MRQKSCTAVFGITRNRCISERYVPNGKIKAAIREARCFKALWCHVHIRIRSGSDASGKRIQLYPANIAL